MKLPLYLICTIGCNFDGHYKMVGTILMKCWDGNPDRLKNVFGQVRWFLN